MMLFMHPFICILPLWVHMTSISHPYKGRPSISQKLRKIDRKRQYRKRRVHIYTCVVFMVLPILPLTLAELVRSPVRGQEQEIATS